MVRVTGVTVSGEVFNEVTVLWISELGGVMDFSTVMIQPMGGCLRPQACPSRPQAVSFQ